MSYGALWACIGGRDNLVREPRHALMHPLKKSPNLGNSGGADCIMVQCKFLDKSKKVRNWRPENVINSQPKRCENECVSAKRVKNKRKQAKTCGNDRGCFLLFAFWPFSSGGHLGSHSPLVVMNSPPSPCSCKAKNRAGLKGGDGKGGICILFATTLSLCNVRLATILSHKCDTPFEALPHCARQSLAGTASVCSVVAAWYCHPGRHAKKSFTSEPEKLLVPVLKGRKYTKIQHQYW